MARSGQPLGHSGKLTNNTIFQCDNDDLMANFWELTKEKEKLQAEIDKTTMEIDGWLQILNCTTTHELGQLIDDFVSSPSLLPPSFTVLHPSPGREWLAQYCDVVTRLNALEAMDIAQGYTTGNGNLFLKFPWRPPNKPNQDCLLLLQPGPDHTYSVVSHNLPPTVPVDDLEKEYLKKPQGPEGIRRFIAVVGQYTRPLYSRLQQIMALESSLIMDGSSVQHNKATTTLRFIVDLKLKENPSLKAQFVLKYDPLDVLPHTVTATPFTLTSKEHIPPGLQDTLDQVATRMKDSMFPQVLLECTKPSSSSTTQDSQDSTLSDSEVSGPLFGSVE